VDIGSSSQPLAPESKQEFLLECVNCHQKNSLDKLASERAVPPFRDGLTEGILICPECGYVTHCYYLSKNLAFKRVEIFNEIKILSEQKTTENFKRVLELKEEYKILFDGEQRKYKEMLEKENGQAA